MVPVAGLEPARHRWQWILSPPRLPIPTHRRSAFFYYTGDPCKIQEGLLHTSCASEKNEQTVKNRENRKKGYPRREKRAITRVCQLGRNDWGKKRTI